MESSVHVLAGVVVPLVTEMSAPGVPSAGLGSAHLEALAAAGVDGMMLLGSNGEGALIPSDLIGEFVRETTQRWRELRPGKPVVVNVSAAGTRDALQRARIVLSAQPDALVVSPPTYFRHRDGEIVDHIAAITELGVPVVVYNVPKYANPLTPAVLEALATMPGVVGIKDSSGDMSTLQEIIKAARDRPDFGISQGDEGALVEGLSAGACGILPGTANLAPRLAVDLHRAYVRGERAEAERLQQLTIALTRIHRVRPGVPTVKAVLAARGFGTRHVAPPLAPCTDEELAAMQAILEQLDDYLIAMPA